MKRLVPHLDWVILLITIPILSYTRLPLKDDVTPVDYDHQLLEDSVADRKLREFQATRIALAHGSTALLGIGIEGVGSAGVDLELVFSD